MFRLSAPDEPTIQRFIEQQSALRLTYQGSGATRNTPPPGYVVDHTRARIGQGDRAYQQATDALRRWDHFQLGWVRPGTPTPIEPDRTVAVLARVFGVWTLNACRIIDVVDEPHRFGFAYGTLPEHMESGEERFLVEFDPTDGAVHYDILAFSRPHHILARIAYPLTRRLQKRFARDSVAAMVKAVACPAAETP